MASFIHEIPSAAWAVIGTLSGVALTAWASRNQLRIQLDHDIKQRERDRHLALRQEIYMEVAEAIARTQNSILRVADIATSRESLAAEFAIDSGNLAKVQVVGTNATLDAVTTFSRAFTAAYFELTLLRVPLELRQHKIATIQDFLSKAQEKRSFYVQLMEQYNLEGNKDPHKWQVLEDNFGFANTNCDNLSNQVNELMQAQLSERIDYTKQCFAAYQKLSALIPSAVFAVRDELALELDKAAYLDSHNHNLSQTKDMFDTYTDKAAQMMGIDATHPPVNPSPEHS